ncbi:MAG: hypothetical protein IT260_21810 [Saprospiraceae bacterium]|nr:hypothetical protein [Saprospiraceae bacterium]
MAKKTFFSPIPSEYTSEQWGKFIPLNSYDVKQVNQLPEFIQKVGVVQKFNSALTVSSGSADKNFYGIIGYRPDKSNTVIDEHAFVFIEDKKTGQIEGGIIHHAAYEGRTTNLSPEMTQNLNLFGVTTKISILRLPTSFSGSLDDLRKENIMDGVTANFYSGSLNTHL